VRVGWLSRYASPCTLQ